LNFATLEAVAFTVCTALLCSINTIVTHLDQQQQQQQVSSTDRFGPRDLYMYNYIDYYY